MENAECLPTSNLSRKEKRKLAKNLKRKLSRREEASKTEDINKQKMNDPEYRAYLLQLEKEEAEREFVERKKHEDEELNWIKREEEFQKQLKRKQEEENRMANEHQEEEMNDTMKMNTDMKNETKPLIIWKGNEIIVMKRKIESNKIEDKIENKIDSEKKLSEYSNPLPPESMNTDLLKLETSSTNQIKKNQNQNQIQNQNQNKIQHNMLKPSDVIGTEKDRLPCSFYLKTGCCRFGRMCRRIHLYPKTSHTLLIKSMYTFPSSYDNESLLEYDEEELEKHYEEFYEDVHFEFQKFGMIVNFKVSKNEANHLRGNVYVEFQKMENAMDAYSFMNGRFYASRQIVCEFIPDCSWISSICGEFLNSTKKVGYFYATCQWGEKCNFLHVMENPGGEYLWVDRNKPAPKAWKRNMEFLFDTEASKYYESKNRKKKEEKEEIRRKKEKKERKKKEK